MDGPFWELTGAEPVADPHAWAGLVVPLSEADVSELGGTVTSIDENGDFRITARPGKYAPSAIRTTRPEACPPAALNSNCRAKANWLPRRVRAASASTSRSRQLMRRSGPVWSAPQIGSPVGRSRTSDAIRRDPQHPGDLVLARDDLGGGDGIGGQGARSGGEDDQAPRHDSGDAPPSHGAPPTTCRRRPTAAGPRTTGRRGRAARRRRVTTQSGSASSAPTAHRS